MPYFLYPVPYLRRGGRVDEGTRLLSGFSPKGGTGVRISPSPCAAKGATAYGE
jgi:hypothetical protein